MRELGSSQPTAVELEILRILWDLGPSPVREVHARLTVRRQTHELILPGIHPETCKISERRIEQAQGMGELKFAVHFDLIASTRTETRRDPFAYAIDSEKSGFRIG